MLKAVKTTTNTPKANMTRKNKKFNSWTIDSGASEHITPHKQLLRTLKRNEDSVG